VKGSYSYRQKEQRERHQTKARANQLEKPVPEIDAGGKKIKKKGIKSKHDLVWAHSG